MDEVALGYWVGGVFEMTAANGLVASKHQSVQFDDAFVDVAEPYHRSTKDITAPGTFVVKLVVLDEVATPASRDTPPQGSAAALPDFRSIRGSGGKSFPFAEIVIISVWRRLGFFFFFFFFFFLFFFFFFLLFFFFSFFFCKFWFFLVL